MDSKAQHDFIKHWHRAVAIEEDETRSEALDAIGQELFDKLQLQPSLRSLAQNPLLCGVICMLHRNRSGYLPQSKSDLYQATTEMFLDTRDRERKVVEDESFATLDHSDKRSFLADIAYWMTCEGLTSIRPNMLGQRIQEKLKFMYRLKGSITSAEVQRFFLERSGLLLKVGADEIQFAHRSFQEFFAAYQVVLIDQRLQALRDNATNDTWHGTIIQAVGLSKSRKSK